MLSKAWLTDLVLDKGLVELFAGFNCGEGSLNNQHSLRSLTVVDKEKQHKEVRVVILGLRHLSQGFIAYLGYIACEAYITILSANLVYGSHVAVIPFLLLLATPFVLIIIGAVNSQSVEYIYKFKTSQHWASLLGQGLVVALAGYYVAFFWAYLFWGVMFPLLRQPYTSAAGPFMVVLALYVPFILYIPTFGYITKAIPYHLVKISSEEFQQNEQRMDVSPKDDAN